MLSPADHAIVQRDPTLPGLRTLLDPARLDLLVQQLRPSVAHGSTTLRYLRYKPGRSCLVGIERTTPHGTEHLVAKAFATNAVEKWRDAQADASARSAPTLQVALWPLVADPGLDGPGWLLDPARALRARSRLRTQWDAADVLAYKPERRLVLRISRSGVPVAVAKCYQPERHARAMLVHAALAGLRPSLLATAIASHERRGVLLLPWLPGAPVDVATAGRDLAGLTGAALASFHALPVRLPPWRSEASGDGGLRQGLEDVACWLPEHAEELEDAYRAVASACRQERDGQEVLLHGDFYAKQLLRTGSGIRLLDLDDCRHGDPHIDLGTFAAHVERDVARGDYSASHGHAVLDAFTAGYASSAPVSSKRRDIRTAEALLRLAPHPFRHRAPGWPQLTMALVRRAVDLVDQHGTVRPGTVPPVSSAGPTTRGGLADDPALAFAAPLLQLPAASALLAQRTGGAAIPDAQVLAARLLRHKPGRRCLIAFDVREGETRCTWLGKVRAKGTDRRAAAIHQHLWQAGVPCIVEPLGVVDDGRMTLQRAVAGHSLREALRADAAVASLAVGVVAAMQTLHRAPVPVARVWQMADERAVLARTLDQADARLDEGSRSRLRECRTALWAAADRLGTRSVRAVIHRDLHQDQVLVDGARIWLVDLDLVALGDPAIDHGNLVAHLIEHGWRHPRERVATERFAEAFLRALSTGGNEAAGAVADATLLALGRLAGLCAVRDDRRAHAADVVARVHALLLHPPARSPLDLLECACAA